MRQGLYDTSVIPKLGSDLNIWKEFGVRKSQNRKSTLHGDYLIPWQPHRQNLRPAFQALQRNQPNIKMAFIDASIQNGSSGGAAVILSAQPHVLLTDFHSGLKSTDRLELMNALVTLETEPKNNIGALLTDNFYAFQRLAFAQIQNFDPQFGQQTPSFNFNRVRAAVRHQSGVHIDQIKDNESMLIAAHAFAKISVNRSLKDTQAYLSHIDERFRVEQITQNTLQVTMSAEI